MIEIDKLSDDDIGRRVIWTVAPGAENPAQLGAWTEDSLVLFYPTKEHKGLHSEFNVDPTKVRWADRLSKKEG
jgi:hypothetical protein